MERRTFIKLTSAGALGLFVGGGLGPPSLLGAAAIPGGTFDPADIPKYRTPLLVPPQMPRAGIKRQGRRLVDYYEISLRQFAQQILPAPLPATTVWGYGPAKVLSPRAPVIYNAPSLTIEANWKRPTRIKWINDLTDANGNYLPHLLPVDPTLHWANPPGGVNGRDTRPTWTSTPEPYSGPVPMVTHVHGAVGVGDESDGYPEAWFLPDAQDVPGGHATNGTWYDFFAGKAAASFGEAWGAGYNVSQYPNNETGTKWYHDHSLGLTRLNVYAGPAGFYIVRGGPQGDLEVRDSRNDRLAILPRPAPSELDQLISSRAFHEIPIVVQDRSFDANGALFYPDTRAFFDGVEGPYLPDTDLSPIWNPEFFGNTLMTNGNTWPYLDVEQRRYRFRFLNGTQSRFLILDFTELTAHGTEVWQIGNEGGFLAEPVDLTEGPPMLLGPAERADVIVDFTDCTPGAFILRNIGPDEPFGGGLPGGDGDDAFEVSDPDTTGQVMQFRVGPSTSRDWSTPPRFLRLPSRDPLPPTTHTRPLALIEEMSQYFPDAPAEALLGTIDGDPNTGPGVWTKRMWVDDVSENPAVGAVEMWEIYNTTGDAHPMHVHEVLFEVVGRQDIIVDETTETVQVVADTVRGPEPGESGVKDTVIAYPGQVTRIKAQFVTPGQYVWHCHIVEHEDNEMMRPYRIGPVQPGQPTT
jgi:FtsP/CotA-like multicopper oxidase with cupredoxin domain